MMMIVYYYHGVNVPEDRKREGQTEKEGHESQVIEDECLKASGLTIEVCAR